MAAIPLRKSCNRDWSNRLTPYSPLWSGRDPEPPRVGAVAPPRRATPVETFIVGFTHADEVIEVRGKGHNIYRGLNAALAQGLAERVMRVGPQGGEYARLTLSETGRLEWARLRALL